MHAPFRSASAHEYETCTRLCPTVAHALDLKEFRTYFLSDLLLDPNPRSRVVSGVCFVSAASVGVVRECAESLPWLRSFCTAGDVFVLLRIVYTEVRPRVSFLDPPCTLPNVYILARAGL